MIYFRPDKDTQEELEIAQDILDVTTNMCDIEPDTTVICRYSFLPFGRWIEDQIRAQGARTINTFAQHEYIAEMFWYDDLEDLTPKTWFHAGPQTVPDTEHGYVIKGRTNSRKFRWNTHMFAPDKEALRSTVSNFYNDAMLADQGLVIREYVPLEKVTEAINGLPITNEWRLFYLNGEYLTGGYYWSIIDSFDNAPPPQAAIELGDLVASKVGNLPFFVVDVARTQRGQWIVIELNDAQMSGLSTIDPRKFYERLQEAINEPST